MPKRADIGKVLLIGSGPIVIGQGCEFDYSGTQAAKALREEGIEVVLVNSNPATIMTDPEVCDRTYIEPLTPESVAKILEKERPDALLPTLGGQTALNVGSALYDDGTLGRLGIEMLGASRESIKKAEDREAFKQVVLGLGLEVPRSGVARSLDDARALLPTIGLPAIIRASYTLGGTGSGIVYNRDEYEAICAYGLECSPIHEILIEESVLGWKEFELEMMADATGNCVVVCTIENFDPMGVHTGDSITVAPAMTLSDRDLQRMRDAAIAIMRAIGVKTGGSNIQFGLDPKTGRMVVIEMNPRVSRSSALASKATGFPIAKIAAKLALGYHLDELPNDITRKTPASFEPALDYVVVKIPRFTFEKFPDADDTLTTSMKAVGEVMAIGRTFQEAVQKAMRSMETGCDGFGLSRRDPLAPEPDPDAIKPDAAALRAKLARPNADRLEAIRLALRTGFTVEEVHELTAIDPWFLTELKDLCVDQEDRLRAAGSVEGLSHELLRDLKRAGFSDAQIARALKASSWEVRARRRELGIAPVYKPVDTCAAEFEAATPYFYGTYEEEDELPAPSGKKKVVILGSGPNRIGQGIEFDYCCVHAAIALREEGVETIMVNSNPETVSTDYDTSDRLFFEPLTLEDVISICEREQPLGVIVQLGGQTPLRLARGLEQAGIPILGTSTDAIDKAEDRARFASLAVELGLEVPKFGFAAERKGAADVAAQIGYPVLVRPSYVLGGRAMEICYGPDELQRVVEEARKVAPAHPVLLDKFLEDAIEVDVDALCDKTGAVLIGGILEHVEEAGTHSGDSSSVIPPHTLSEPQIREIRRLSVALAQALQVVGLMNVQFAIKGERIYCLEVNPRGSRTVPFVSKASGLEMAKIATRLMLGYTLQELGAKEPKELPHTAIKMSVFPWKRFPGVDAITGLEMRSTGEVMGIADSFGAAFAKAYASATRPLPRSGKVFLSVKDADKRELVSVAKRLVGLGFELVATSGTQKALTRNDVPCQLVRKLHEGRPHVLDALKNGEYAMVINTPTGKEPRNEGGKIRSASVALDIPCLTSMAAAEAAVCGMEAMRRQGDAWLSPRPLQDYLARVKR